MECTSKIGPLCPQQCRPYWQGTTYESRNSVQTNGATSEIPETDYFDVTTKGGVLILRPVTVSEPGSRLATVRQKIKDLGIEPKDLDRAIAWARGRRGRRR